MASSGSARRAASQVSVKTPPPYTEASNNLPLFGTALSTVSSLLGRCSARPAPLPAVDSKADSSRTKLQKDTTKDSATFSSVAFADARENIPPDVHLVQTPYEFKRKNTSILRGFLLFKGDSPNTFLPDIRLRTKNALLQSAVYVNPEEWGRPVQIYARTKNADLILGVHTLQAEQAVRIRATTKNGRNRTFLPRDFKGLLAVSTKNGKCTLSPDLKRHAVRVPSRYILEKKESFEDCSSSDCSSVTETLSDGVDVWYAINGGGVSSATMDTKNGDVWVGFVEEEEEVSCWTGCSVM